MELNDFLPQDLIKLLKSEFGVNLEDAIDALMLPPSVQDARILHEAMKVRPYNKNERKKIVINFCFSNSLIVHELSESIYERIAHHMPALWYPMKTYRKITSDPDHISYSKYSNQWTNRAINQWEHIFEKLFQALVLLCFIRGLGTLENNKNLGIRLSFFIIAMKSLIKNSNFCFNYWK